MTGRFRISSLLPEQLREHGLALPAVLREAGLPSSFFEQEKVYADTAELFALWRAIGRLSDDPAIGLKLGAEPRLERNHPAAIAAICSRTFRDALQRIARYKQLTCPEEVRVHTLREEVSVEFVFVDAEGVEPDVLVDLVLSWVLSIGRRGSDGRIAPVRLELTRPARQRELLERYFGCPVRFRRPRNAIVFRKSDLDRPFVTSNADLLAVVGAQLDMELEAGNGNTGIRDRVRNAVRRSLAGRRPTLANIARELGLSPRTLQRRLNEEQVTFQKVVEDTRREMARHYLGRSDVELNEAAFLLGFEDANSFFRAFHAWESATPGEWRARHREMNGPPGGRRITRPGAGLMRLRT